MPFTADPMMNRLILVIDDNPLVCEDFRKILQTNIRASSLAEARAALFEDTPQDDLQEGFEVDYADQGQTGLAMVESAVQRSCPYAVAFVDMLMPPGWDGIETITYLWQADPELEIVMCTAFTDLLWDRLTEQFGHTDKLLILRKPFDNIEVWQLASALTQKWHLAQQARRQLASFHDMVEQHRQELQMVNEHLQAAITQRQQAEEALAQRTHDWAHSRADLERFAYTTSHDLRESLHMVTSYLHLLAQDYRGRLDATADAFIASVVDGPAWMQRLIQELLTYWRVETQPQVFAPIDGEQVLTLALANLQGTIAASGAVVTHTPLPTVMVDAAQFVQLVQHLLENAIKFRSTQPPHVHLTVTRQEVEWVFAVCDNGIGLDPAHAEHIFGLWQRLHSDTAYPGTGLGLAICKKIVERHGGRIWVESQPENGATFFFTIPIQAPSSEDVRL
jgi:two-component system, NtrC family, sensor kinase